MKRATRVLLGICAAAALALPAGCEPLTLDPFLYDPLPAPAEGYQLSRAVIPAYQDFFVDTRDGERLHLVRIPPRPGGSGLRPLTLVYFHGQSNNIGSSWPRLEWLYPLGVEIYAVDPRGYGRSTGSPSESGIAIDLADVHRFLISVRGVPPGRLVYYGRSLGGALAIHLAYEASPAGLITESTFTSVPALVRDGAYADLPARLVVDSVWDNLSKIRSVTSAYLILHGTSDPYVRYPYAEQLASAHGGTHELVPVDGADHGDLPQKLSLAGYRDVLLRFLSGLTP